MTTQAEAIKKLSPQGRALLEYLQRTGSVTQREALMDLSIQSLTKRISELREFCKIESDRRYHKVTNQRYVRYFFQGFKDEDVAG